MRIFLFVFGIILMGTLHADVYKWTDSSGNVHFTDEPQPGAEKVELPPAEVFSSPPPPPSPTTPEDAALPTPPDYKANIITPENEATVRNNYGYVEVVVKLTPALQAGDKLQMVFDGKPLGEPQSTTVFKLNGIYRGTHTIAVEVMDKSGQVLTTSDTVTIYMHRPRINMVPRSG